MAMIPQYNTELFTDIWDNKVDFVEDIINIGNAKVSVASLEVLYSLLYARYGNSPIANLDVNQFKAKMWSIIYQYGPTWEKRVEIQDKIRALNEDEITGGGKAVYNKAFNPDTEPSTSSLDEINYISQQDTTNFKKSKLEGYSVLMNLLETNVTGEFIDKFKVCFKQFVMPEHPIIYESED